MAVTYTWGLRAPRRPVSGRGRRRWGLWAPPLLGALACATGGAPLPRGAPPLAPGSTPEPVRYEVIVPGTRLDVRARLTQLLSDSLFHVSASDAASLAAYSLARLVKVHVDLTASGKDSIRVGLTGETYMGDTARRDSISGLPERWRLLTATDAGGLVLRNLARSLHLIRAPARLGDTTESTGEVLAPAAPVPPPAGSTGDPQVEAILARTPVGRGLDVCRSPSVPVGWLILYWYTDRSKCTKLPDDQYPAEPNVMRIEREW